MANPISRSLSNITSFKPVAIVTLAIGVLVALFTPVGALAKDALPFGGEEEEEGGE